MYNPIGDQTALFSILEKAYSSFERGDFVQTAELCQELLDAEGEQAPTIYLLGLIAQRMSEFDRARNYFQRAIELEPQNHSYLAALAEIFSQMGDTARAIDCWQKVIHLNPTKAVAYYNLANLYYANDKSHQAEKNYRRALKINSDLVEAHYNLGNLFLDQKRYPEASDAYLEALVHRPDCVEAHFNLGIVLMEQRRFEEAIDRFNKVIGINPSAVAAYYNMGCIFLELNNFEKAALSYQQAVALKPDFVEAYNNLGNACLEIKRKEEAEQCFRKAIALKPDYADGHYNLGKVLQERFEFEAALDCYRRALEINPEYSKAYNNSGKIFHDMGNIRQAVSLYHKALDIQPDYAEARFNLATSELLLGHFKSGWESYESRFHRAEWRQVYPYRFDLPRWEGQPLDGKTIYVHSEQGLGDILQFVRYLPKVKSFGGHVILETIKPLLSICRRMTSIDQVVEPQPDGRPAVGFDYYIPLLSLPALFGTNLETIPSQVPYLSTTEADLQRWRPRISEKGLRVGLVWAGTSTDPRRACPLGWFTPLTRLKNVHFYGLQKGIAAEQVEVDGLPEGMRMVNLGQEFEDFSDTAAVVDQMDLVISIDTSVAHLAGAMGKRLWVLLPDVPDWRWLLNRNDSPWYPSARLFRQIRPGDWQPVIQEIADALVELIRR